MSKKLAITLIVVGFLVGAFIAGGSVGCYFVHHLRKLNKILDYQFECQPRLDTSIQNIAALKTLRANETSNTIEYLELQLDYSVAAIGRHASTLPLTERDLDSAMMHVFGSAKTYRNQFPHTNQDAYLQKDIEQAFSLVHE